MYKSRHNFFKKRNKCEVTIKSTITKRTIAGKKVVETIIKKKMHQNRQIERERERERESTDLFCSEQLGKNRGERRRESTDLFCSEQLGKNRGERRK